MPSAHIFHYFTDHMNVENYWAVDGIHYQKTARAWLDNMDQKSQIFKVLKTLWRERLQKVLTIGIFFMSCEELWKYDNGSEWFVGHSY